jgi:hypothetical protein
MGGSRFIYKSQKEKKNTHISSAALLPVQKKKHFGFLE